MANLRWLARYRHWRCGRETDVAMRLTEVFRQPRRLRARLRPGPPLTDRLAVLAGRPAEHLERALVGGSVPRRRTTVKGRG